MKRLQDINIGFLLMPPHQWLWSFIGHAAQQQASRLGVCYSTITLDFPPLDRRTEDEVAQQVTAVHEFIRRGVDAVIIPALNANDPAFLAALRAARNAGIQIIAIDHAIGHGIESCALFSNNSAGAEAIAAFAAERLGGRGNIVHLQGNLPVQVAVERSDAFHRILDRFPGIKIVFEAPGAWLPESGFQLMRQALAHNPDIQAVITASDGLALGAIEVLEEAGLSGQVLVTGFDGMPDALRAIQRGQLAATVSQSPDRMGSRVVDLAVQVVQGRPTPPITLIDVELVTVENLLPAAINLLAVFPSMIEGIVQGNQRERQLQEQAIETQRRLIDELSARKQVEEAIRFQARLLDAVEEAVIAVDCETTITHWGRGAELLYGWPASDAIGRPFGLILGGADPEQASELAAHLRAGAPWSGEVEVRHRAGATCLVLMINSPIQEQGRLAGSVSISFDISERKRAEEERLKFERRLLETQKLESLGVLAGGIAHDFNNLLMAILGNASLALMELGPGAPARTSIAQIEYAARHASDLTHQLLAYAGKGRFITQNLNLNSIVEEMTHLLRVSVPKNVMLRYNLSAQPLLIEADPTQIRQVIMNLVINAAEAIGGSNGLISMTTGAQLVDQAQLAETYMAPDLPPGHYIYLEVSDTGAGMDAATRAKIFEPFFTTKFTGRGLGLAAVLGIVHGHRGALKVYSEPGRGSTFKFLLPSKAGAATSEAGDADTPDWHGAGTILVIDDEASVRSVVTRMLERLGFSVLVAEDGAAGIEVFRSHAQEIVCVLLDMTMPRLSGDMAFRALRQIKPDVQVILMSGYNEQDATSQFSGKGLAGFLAKPFSAAELRARLQLVVR